MTEPPPLQVGDVAVASAVNERWSEHAQALELAALPAIRASAERWTASLTAVLGAVSLAALLNGPDRFAGIDEPWRNGAKAAFGVAAMLALIAAFRAAGAARVTSAKVFLPGGAAYREAASAAVSDALAALTCSRRLAIGSVIAAIAAAAMMWGAPRAPRTLSLRIHGTGDCARFVAIPAAAQLAGDRSLDGLSIDCAPR